MPGGYRQWRTMAGLRVPCGIVIPWFTGETLWAVKVRRESGQPKYVQISGGSSGGLYRGDALEGAQAVLFTEGEFDALDRPPGSRAAGHGGIAGQRQRDPQ